MNGALFKKGDKVRLKKNIPLQEFHDICLRDFGNNVDNYETNNITVTKVQKYNHESFTCIYCNVYRKKGDSYINIFFKDTMVDYAKENNLDII